MFPVLNQFAYRDIDKSVIIEVSISDILIITDFFRKNACLKVDYKD